MKLLAEIMIFLVSCVCMVAAQVVVTRVLFDDFGLRDPWLGLIALVAGWSVIYPMMRPLAPLWAERTRRWRERRAFPRARVIR